MNGDRQVFLKSVIKIWLPFKISTIRIQIFKAHKCFTSSDLNWNETPIQGLKVYDFYLLITTVMKRWGFSGLSVSVITSSPCAALQGLPSFISEALSSLNEFPFVLIQISSTLVISTCSSTGLRLWCSRGGEVFIRLEFIRLTNAAWTLVVSPGLLWGPGCPWLHSVSIQESAQARAWASESSYSVAVQLPLALAGICSDICSD